jgi:hypothetical protein
MIEHPSVSAVGSHIDELTEIAVLARRYYEEEGCPEGRELEHWLRAERELHSHATSPAPAPEKPPAEPDRKIEEAMHLDQ